MHSPVRPLFLPASRGFTLIELLTVIAIIGILAAIIIPVVGKVRVQARSAQCLSNLRQIALATDLYGSDNRNLYPLGRNSGNETYWYHFVPAYLGDKRTGYGAVFSPVLTCPGAESPPTATDRSSYAANPAVMPDRNSLALRVSRTRVQRPSEVVLFADSGTAAGGNASWGLTAQADVYANNAANADNPIPDSSSSTGNAVIRWRHSDRANFAFVDGHVAALRVGELKQRNLQINY